VDIISGFHLLNPPERQLRKTVEAISQWQPKELHACHCKDLKSKLALSKAADLQEVWVGIEIKY
jgi:7,8-dihydropterin-6-yl-methyl-4-(beta-D-ribofuranosyl)aminobenzene 5'-phosphate synthase